MFALARIALVSTVLAAPAFSAQAFALTVPQTELNNFCAEYGTSRIHLATFFLDDGIRLRGHVNCKTVSFMLSMILPPIDEQVAGGN